MQGGVYGHFKTLSLCLPTPPHTHIKNLPPDNLVLKLTFMAGKKGKGKGKAIPLGAWTGPEGSRGLRLPDFKTIGT